MPVEVKQIGTSGQISLGKQHAGKTVTVEEVEGGVWLIKTAQVIPDSEMWLHAPEMAASLDRALAWSEKSERTESDLAELGRRIKQGK